MPVMRERRDSLLARSTESGVRAKAKTPMRSDHGPRPVRVLCRPGDPSTGVIHVLYVIPTKVKTVKYPIRIVRISTCSLVVCPKTGVQILSGRRYRRLKALMDVPNR